MNNAPLSNAVSISEPTPAPPKRFPWQDYALALATVALMCAVRAALNPLLGTRAPFATFYFGLIFISIRCGARPAVLSLLVSFLLATYFFAGNHSVLPQTTAEGIGSLFNFLNGGSVIALVQRQRRTFAELAEREAAARRHLAALETETQARRQAEAEREQNFAKLEDSNLRLRRAMQETHHRVKNNLQVVSALVEMQEDPDFPPAALDALRRIGQHARTLATVHDVLTLQAKSDSEMAEVPVTAIIPRLLGLMETTLQGRHIQCEVDDIRLTAEQAASLALLVNELVNNAIKHGHGDIEVTLHRVDGSAELEVCDDGPGFPADFDPRRAAHTGLELIDSMGRWDLRGTVAYGNQATGGARVQVAFPLPEQA